MILNEEPRHLERDMQVVLSNLFTSLRFGNSFVTKDILVPGNKKQKIKNIICFMIKAPWALILTRSIVIFIFL